MSKQEKEDESWNCPINRCLDLISAVLTMRYAQIPDDVHLLLIIDTDTCGSMDEVIQLMSNEMILHVII